MNQKTATLKHLETRTVIGISGRTRNDKEMKGEGIIPAFWGRFYQEEVLSKIPGKIPGGPVMAIYTEYESDETGEYTFILGAPVEPGTTAPAGLVIHEIPAGDYQVSESAKGPLGQVVARAWGEIWADQELKARRRYAADYEIYDERAANPEDGLAEIYIGVK